MVRDRMIGAYEPRRWLHVVTVGGAAMKTKDAAEAFLSAGRIAVTGVSRDPKGHGSNAVYGRLRSRGYDVVAINPHAFLVEGDVCYPNLSSVPGGVQAVVIGTRPERALATVQECADLGVKYVWMHRGFGKGSVSEEAARLGRSHGITVIDGGCPSMFGAAADRGHKVMKLLLSPTHAVPRAV